MEESPQYEVGDWFQDEIGWCWEYRYDIDSNTIGWFETCVACLKDESRKIDPPLKTTSVNIYTMLDGQWILQKRLYGVRGIEFLGPNPQIV
jgi:hypothetical protein